MVSVGVSYSRQYGQRAMDNAVKAHLNLSFLSWRLHLSRREVGLASVASEPREGGSITLHQ
jgi:hypothetical protein